MSIWLEKHKYGDKHWMRIVSAGIKQGSTFAVLPMEVGIGIYFQLEVLFRVDDDTLVLGSLQIFT